MVRESDIVYENPFAWVLRESNAYVVMRPGVTHSTSDSAYARDADGLSIATARAVYFLKAKVNEILKTRWTDEHRVEAIREGWDLWTSFGSENGPLQVQRFDDVEEAQFALEDLCAKLGAPGRPLPCSVIPEFTRDDGVMSILANGSAPHHTVAMSILEQCNPIEWKLLHTLRAERQAPKTITVRGQSPELVAGPAQHVVRATSADFLIDTAGFVLRADIELSELDVYSDVDRFDLREFATFTKQPIEPGVEFNILMLGALLDDNRYIEPDTHRAQMKDPVPDEAESAHASAPS